MKSSLFPFLAAVSAFAGCAAFGGLSQEDRDRLTLFQQNAQTYWDGQRFGQALDAVEQGLEIDPDNYKLMSIRGWCYLRTANRERERLRDAERSFDAAWKQRRPLDHQPYLLLGYGRMKQEIGLWHRDTAKTLAEEARDPELGATGRTTRLSSAEEHRRKAETYWREADRAFATLVERQELLSTAYKARMEIAVEFSNFRAAVENGRLCLDRLAAEQAAAQAIIAETMVAQTERKARADLQELVVQEVRVRSAMAEMLFRNGEFAPTVEHLDVLLAIDPSRSIDYYNRAIALESLQRTQDARRDFDRFLRTTSLAADDPRVVRAFAATRDRDRDRERAALGGGDR